ncbi:hypothetical protein [Clavibacter nebraskensis]|uniref:Lipoprotein n=2 Tax=Clavibacter nebraskensis TaxID=31963 RepID=A0AAI8ZHF4_9MICO|nr:hypothetical protein [Clavibacter nebraskensis]KXU21302.1 hypothetical protein VV38_04770 [Clavibacter nebraskensis]OAH19974.1 hypothetical protein A3Q38_06950 [Clavibacter nebraskensis]QGV66258.1 hypothetical protein EGX36_05110 [Clavibacter nebraskensis]QGV69056.1 hypothetical protein EGX37_05100 [Clavibacter nebraskensis]QGV71846.1 hypothetical protein EGX35_05100 [Clavibacter nebraskensis]
MARMHRTAPRIRPWAPVLVAAAGALALAGCTVGADAPVPAATTPASSATPDAGAAPGGNASPEPTVTRAPGPPTEDELATCSTLAQVLPDSTKLVQALGDGEQVDPPLFDRVKQGDAALAGMAPEGMKPLVASFSTIVDELDALRSGADTDGASLDTGQYLRATNAFLDYCLDDVGYVPQTATPTPAP